MLSRTGFLSLFAIATISSAQALDFYAQSPIVSDATTSNPVAVKTSNLAVSATSKTSKIPTETGYFPITDLAKSSDSPGGETSQDSVTLSAAGYMVSDSIPSFLSMLMAMMFM